MRLHADGLNTSGHARALPPTHYETGRLTMYFDFAHVLVFLLLGLGLSGMMLGLGRLLRPSNPLVPKLGTYECGEPPTGNAWINFNIRFYLVALIFVIFDVEIAFMYPVMAVYRDWLLGGRGRIALTEMLLFIGVL